MALATTQDVFHATSAKIVRESVDNFSWYRIHIYGEDEYDVHTITVFPDLQKGETIAPPPEKFFNFPQLQDPPAQPLEASPAPASTSTSESNLEQ